MMSVKKENQFREPVEGSSADASADCQKKKVGGCSSGNGRAKRVLQLTFGDMALLLFCSSFTKQTQKLAWRVVALCIYGGWMREDF
ncbi:hypothetical protein TNIN_328691 [Trichonephila inaurata madagascariensis]|uniref:Uncharacterized protein n=1 Tax=Trichonephila inaurata madagascariensis TaxID=2747483 RepID=A0A8X7CJL1_9ARAC|nr:hypothetical protein TNIN_328691 [Trichonephila inaurata madagascariensis]